MTKKTPKTKPTPRCKDTVDMFPPAAASHILQPKADEFSGRKNRRETMSNTTVLRIMIIDDDTGELLDQRVTDEDLACVLRCMDEGSRNGISVFDNRAEYNKAQEE